MGKDQRELQMILKRERKEMQASFYNQQRFRKHQNYRNQNELKNQSMSEYDNLKAFMGDSQILFTTKLKVVFISRYVQIPFCWFFVTYIYHFHIIQDMHWWQDVPIYQDKIDYQQYWEKQLVYYGIRDLQIDGVMEHIEELLREEVAQSVKEW